MENYFENHKQAFDNAHKGTSFSPEIRSKQEQNHYNALLHDDLEFIKEHAKSVGNYEEKFINKVVELMRSRGRCLSFMITGGANFPVRRNQKANEAHHNKYEAFDKWRSNYINRATATPTPSPEEDLDRYVAEIDKMLIEHETMLKINKIIMSKRLTKEEKIKGLDELDITKKMQSDIKYSGCIASYVLSSSRTKIKRMKDECKIRQARIARKESFEPILFDGGRIDIENDRVVIYHDEKPSREVITNIKSNGFRWSPKVKCWCRKHTANALIAAKLAIK